MGTHNENTPPCRVMWDMSIHNQLFITEASETVNNFYSQEEMRGTGYRRRRDPLSHVWRGAHLLLLHGVSLQRSSELSWMCSC